MCLARPAIHIVRHVTELLFARISIPGVQVSNELQATAMLGNIYTLQSCQHRLRLLQVLSVPRQHRSKALCLLGFIKTHAALVAITATVAAVRGRGAGGECTQPASTGAGHPEDVCCTQLCPLCEATGCLLLVVSVV